MGIHAYLIEVAYGKGDSNLSIQNYGKGAHTIIFMDKDDAIRAAQDEFQAVSGMKLTDKTVMTTDKTSYEDAVYCLFNDPDLYEDYSAHKDDDWWQYTVRECEVATAYGN